jgi:cytochrome P450
VELTRTKAQFQRVVGKPVTLSDGTYLPRDTIIEVPLSAVMRDAQLYPNPETFDAYRFYNLRKAGSESIDRYQCVTVTPTNIAFGYGRHACPGRFLAIAQIKLVLANLLLQFEMKMPNEQKKRHPVTSRGNAVSTIKLRLNSPTKIADYIR